MDPLWQWTEAAKPEAILQVEPLAQDQSPVDVGPKLQVVPVWQTLHITPKVLTPVGAQLQVAPASHFRMPPLPRFPAVQPLPHTEQVEFALHVKIPPVFAKETMQLE